MRYLYLALLGLAVGLLEYFWVRRIRAQALALDRAGGSLATLQPSTRGPFPWAYAGVLVVVLTGIGWAFVHVVNRTSMVSADGAILVQDTDGLVSAFRLADEPSQTSSVRPLDLAYLGNPLIDQTFGHPHRNRGLRVLSVHESIVASHESETHCAVKNNIEIKGVFLGGDESELPLLYVEVGLMEAASSVAVSILQRGCSDMKRVESPGELARGTYHVGTPETVGTGTETSIITIVPKAGRGDLDSFALTVEYQRSMQNREIGAWWILPQDFGEEELLRVSLELRLENGYLPSSIIGYAQPVYENHAFPARLWPYPDAPLSISPTISGKSLNAAPFGPVGKKGVIIYFKKQRA